MTYRIRIKRPDGEMVVVDKTHSQVCEYLSDITREEFRSFLDRREITLPTGDSVRLVKYV